MTRTVWNTVLVFVFVIYFRTTDTPYTAFKSQPCLQDQFMTQNSIHVRMLCQAFSLKARLFFRYSSSAAPERLCHIYAPNNTRESTTEEEEKQQLQSN